MLAIAFVAACTFIFLRAPQPFKKPISLKFVEDILDRKSIHASIRQSKMLKNKENQRMSKVLGLNDPLPATRIQNQSALSNSDLGSLIQSNVETN